jgi:hypothetical protein
LEYVIKSTPLTKEFAMLISRQKSWVILGPPAAIIDRKHDIQIFEKSDFFAEMKIQGNIHAMDGPLE